MDVDVGGLGCGGGVGEGGVVVGGVVGDFFADEWGEVWCGIGCGHFDFRYDQSFVTTVKFVDFPGESFIRHIVACFVDGESSCEPVCHVNGVVNGDWVFPFVTDASGGDTFYGYEG